jgi:hypothetical protein
MAALASVVAYLFAPPDGSPAMTVSSPVLMVVTALLYFPIVLIPAIFLPTRILEQRLGIEVLAELALRVVAPAFLVAIVEAYAFSRLDGEGGVDFSLHFAMTLGAMVTILFVAQIAMLLQRNRASAA